MLISQNSDIKQYFFETSSSVIPSERANGVCLMYVYYKAVPKHVNTMYPYNV